MAKPTLDLRIRPAVVDDVPTILGLIRELAEYEKLEQELTVTEDLLRAYLFGPRPAAEALMASVGGRDVGYAVYFTNYSTFSGRPGLFLEDLYVQPHVRGRGVGKALLREVARIALERDCNWVGWTVLDWNEPAIQFYKSLGAVPMSDWTMFRLGEDAIERFAKG